MLVNMVLVDEMNEMNVTWTVNKEQLSVLEYLSTLIPHQLQILEVK